MALLPVGLKARLSDVDYVRLSDLRFQKREDGKVAARLEFQLFAVDPRGKDRPQPLNSLSRELLPAEVAGLMALKPSDLGIDPDSSIYETLYSAVYAWAIGSIAEFNGATRDP